MAQLAGVGGQDCDEALVESGSYQVTAHPASSLVNATTRGRHVNARAPAGPVISKGQTPGGSAVTMGPYPRILDTGYDYAALGSVAARWAS